MDGRHGTCTPAWKLLALHLLGRPLFVRLGFGEAPILRFRIRTLLLYAVGGAAIMAAIVWVIYPPNPEIIGITDYRIAWTLLLVTGAALGVHQYCLLFFFQRRQARIDSLSEKAN